MYKGILIIIFGIYTCCQQMKVKVCVGNLSVVKIYIIRPKPGPVAKNATPRPSGWESNPCPLDYQTSALPLSYRSCWRQLGCEFSLVIQRTRVRFPAGRPWSCIFGNWSWFGSYNVYLYDIRISYTNVDFHLQYNVVVHTTAH